MFPWDSFLISRNIKNLYTYCKSGRFGLLLVEFKDLINIFLQPDLNSSLLIEAIEDMNEEYPS